jgi:poly(hydroxyalkanoate) depolymerase family esterase
MAGLRRTLDELHRYHHKLKTLFAKEAGGWRAGQHGVVDRLRPVTGFGTNPGRLRMLSYVPPNLPPGAPLVLVLHGCTQSAAAFDHATGWSTLADRCGFALLYPEQTRDNNPNLCFNWFDPAHTARGRGEACSIKQMIDHMVAEHRLDRARIGITGLSAGGAMAAVMLATYPEVFAAGAIIAGLPFGCATNVQQAFESMMQGRSRSAAEWAALVRNASSHAGPWPKLSIWHGDADQTVLPSNAAELVKQWTAIHGLAARPTLNAALEGMPYRAWHGRDGTMLVESITIPGMGHGAPIATGLGHAAPFVLDVGISSTHHIARSWGLTAAPFVHGAAEQAADAYLHRPSLAVPVGRDEARSSTNHATRKPGLALDPAAVIHDALRAAGLLK